MDSHGGLISEALKVKSVSGFCKETFDECYRNKRPLLITGPQSAPSVLTSTDVASKWPALERWQDVRYMVKEVGEKAKEPQRVFVSNDNLHFLASKGVQVENMSLEEVFSRISKGGKISVQSFG